MKTIATLKDKNGSCELLLDIRNVSEKELTDLLEQVAQHKLEKRQKELELQNTLDLLKQELESLKQEIKVLKGEE